MPVQIPLYGGVTPQRTQSPDEFANNGDDWLEYQAPLPATYNALATEVNDNAIVAEGAKDDAVSARNITLDAKNVVVNAQSDVTAKAEQVTIDTQTVSDNTQMVVDAQSDVTAKAEQVTIDTQT
ncbi:hypothetical protein, partial [Vibrio casei]|uniref:hypothetical protein n=1 Tax=Vibrio casei TaxID=673372 RepID=UPI003F993502